MASSTEHRFEVTTHAPDAPFGCAAQWGPPIGAVFADMALHVCNEVDQHEDDHVCTCGATADNVGMYPRSHDG